MVAEQKEPRGPAADGVSAGPADAVEEPVAEGSDQSPEAEDSAPEAEVADGDEELAVRFETLSDQYMRLAADFDNFRRRTRAQEAEVRAQAAADLMKNLLPVIDNLQLALAKTEAAADDGFAQGIVLIEQQLLAVLHDHGLRTIATVGQAFDPHLMEAIAQVDGPEDVAPGHVLEELRPGYVLHDKVLRPAQVVVAKGE